jgi:cytochrome c oxidase subunit 2
MWDFPLLPEQASTVASETDSLYFFLIAITAFFSLLIAGAIIYFAIKYRRGTKADRSNPVSESKTLEAVWIAVPLAICMVIFFWGAKLFFTLTRPPAQAEDIYVTGKQWMWKFQHIGGQREINELHIPVGRSFKTVMTSEDVIHSLYIPSFRVKQDVLPGRYTQLWFQATKPGTYHIFCAEYCGTEHSGMIGRVVVMEPGDYEKWLNTWQSSSTASGGAAMMSAGEKVFESQGCNTCHVAGDATRAPLLQGLYGKSVTLKGGGTVTADDQYIRESILTSTAKVVAGYEPIMPIYQGRISEDDLMQLVAYIKSMGSGGATSTTASAPAAGAGTTAAATTAAAGGENVSRVQAQGTTDRPTGTSGRTESTGRK